MVDTELISLVGGHLRVLHRHHHHQYRPHHHHHHHNHHHRHHHRHGAVRLLNHISHSLDRNNQKNRSQSSFTILTQTNPAMWSSRSPGSRKIEKNKFFDQKQSAIKMMTRLCENDPQRNDSIPANSLLGCWIENMNSWHNMKHGWSRMWTHQLDIFLSTQNVLCLFLLSILSRLTLKRMIRLFCIC